MTAATEERWGCWYCYQDFESMTDAWRHMDNEHPEESAVDLAQMDADTWRAKEKRS